MISDMEIWMFDGIPRQRLVKFTVQYEKQCLFTMANYIWIYIYIYIAIIVSSCSCWCSLLHKTVWQNLFLEWIRLKYIRWIPYFFHNLWNLMEFNFVTKLFGNLRRISDICFPWNSMEFWQDVHRNLMAFCSDANLHGIQFLSFSISEVTCQ